MPATGDNRRLTINNIDYRITGGSDFSRKSGRFVKTSVPTSGAPDVKFEQQNQDIEGVEIQTTGTERENIIDVADQVDDVPIAYVNSRGDSYTFEGQVTVTADSTQDGKMTLTLIPTNDIVPIVV